METFAREIVESKIWLAETKCENLKEAQTQLVEYIGALEERLLMIQASTEPLVVDHKDIEDLHSLQLRLERIDGSLRTSLARLRKIQSGLAIRPVT